MSRLAVVSFPILEEPDREWIESMRVRHDPLAPQLAVHFTYVFPFKAEPSADLENHVASMAKSGLPIQFEIDRAELAPDPIGGGGNLFLLLRQGGDRIIELHDRMYEGALRPHLRIDLPYVPHVTIGKMSDLAAGQQLAQELTVRGRGIRGSIETVELLTIDASGITSIAKFDLGRV